MGMVQHIFDLLTSWALVAEVWYLPPMHRNVSLYKIHVYATHTSISQCITVVFNSKKKLHEIYRYENAWIFCFEFFLL